MRKYSAPLMMLGIAIVSMAIHLVAGWSAFVEDASAHGEKAEMGAYLIEWTRDTFENWQSEFIRLAFQTALLAGLFTFMGVHAHDEDHENIKRMLREMQSRRQV